MSAGLNLNDCKGTLIIDNDQNISLPGVYKTNSYDINLETPCFFINNHFLSPLLRSYSVTLPNPVSLEFCDEIKISIKIPKNIFGEKYGYSLEGVVKELNNRSEEEFKASLRLKSSDGCLNIQRCLGHGVTINDYCGWLVITISYKVGESPLNYDRMNERNNGPEQICNLCELSYSICFDPIKVKSLYGQCNGHNEETIEFPIETCLLLKNNHARREYFISEQNKISGPENFLCLEIIEDSSIDEVIVWDKFNKTLTINKYGSNTYSDEIKKINSRISNINEHFDISNNTDINNISKGKYNTKYVNTKDQDLN